MRDLNKTFGDQRTRDRGAEQVETFVNSVRAEHREDEVANEFFTNVFDVDVFGFNAEHFSLGTCRFQFFALTKVSSEGNNFAAVFGLQPFQNDRRVEAAGIGEDHFLGCRHRALL